MCAFRILLDHLARLRFAALAGLVFPLLLASGAETAATVLDSALAALAAGDSKQASAFFRYFDEQVAADEAGKDRQVLQVFFQLLQQHFGRPGQFERIRVTTPQFVNFFIESATPDLWRNSDCFFKGVGFRTTFTSNDQRRPAEVIVDMCVDAQARPLWLHKMDFHFMNPDQTTIDRAQAFFQRFRQEVQRIRGAKA